MLNIPARLQSPNATHLLSTDHFGRDIWCLIMVDARTYITAALAATGIGIALGIPLGLRAAPPRGPGTPSNA